jgi:hypothetical protein
VWYCVELEVQVGTSGYVKLYVNGNLEISVTNIDNSARQFAHVHVGIDQIYGTVAATVYTDCVVVAGTYVGPEPEVTIITVTDSVGLSDAVLCHKSFAVADSVGLTDTVLLPIIESIRAMSFPMTYIVKFPEEAPVKVDGVNVGVLDQPIVGATGKVYVDGVECGSFTIEAESGPVYVDTTTVGTYSGFVWRRAKMLISKVEGVTISHVAKDFPKILIKSGKAQELRSKFST